MCQIYYDYGEITSAGTLKSATLNTTVAIFIWIYFYHLNFTVSYTYMIKKTMASLNREEWMEEDLLK